MDFPCSPPMLAGALTLSIAAAPAIAQTYRPDAEGYPCSREAQRAVVQSDAGFLIRDRSERPSLREKPAAIKLGNSNTIDGRIFARTSLVRPEPTHVSQR